MRTIRLYHPKLSSTLVGQSIELNKEQTHHAVTVLRVKKGQAVTLFDGQSYEFLTTVLLVEKRRIVVEINDFKHCPATDLLIHLGIAVSKGERMDWVIQKATELGASHITPLTSQRVDVKLSADRWEKKQTHWEKIIINACEQCGQNILPQLHPVTPLTDWIENRVENKKLVMDPEGETLTLQKTDNTASCALLVGPEGGLDDWEIQQAQQQGFERWKLGNLVLRTETAPVAGIAILQYSLG